MQAYGPYLLVQSASGDSQRGVASIASRRFACALGSAGIVGDKREGDGGTPIGRFPPRLVLYRADRLAPPRTALPVRALDLADGWCDQPGAPTYNSMVRLPHPYRHERLWREDHLYDLILVIGHNDAPPIAGRGSAVFVHLAREDYGPTEGCIAFAREDLLEILSTLTLASTVVVRN